MKDEVKFTLRIDKTTAQKLDYIAQYYGRSRSSEIIWAARKHILAFEQEFGKICVPGEAERRGP